MLVDSTGRTRLLSKAFAVTARREVHDLRLIEPFAGVEALNVGAVPRS